jgi:hypothetical protein
VGIWAAQLYTSDRARNARIARAGTKTRFFVLAAQMTQKVERPRTAVRKVPWHVDENPGTSAIDGNGDRVCSGFCSPCVWVKMVHGTWISIPPESGGKRCVTGFLSSRRSKPYGNYLLNRSPFRVTGSCQPATGERRYALRREYSIIPGKYWSQDLRLVNHE